GPVTRSQACVTGVSRRRCPPRTAADGGRRCGAPSRRAGSGAGPAETMSIGPTRFGQETPMEQWDTKEKIAAARERLEESHHDWRRPAAYGVGVYRDGATEFTRVNQNGNYLPAVILARVTGHTRGTSSHPVS